MRFELMVRFPGLRFSRPVHSTTLPHLHSTASFLGAADYRRRPKLQSWWDGANTQVVQARFGADYCKTGGSCT